MDTGWGSSFSLVALPGVLLLQGGDVVVVKTVRIPEELDTKLRRIAGILNMEPESVFDSIAAPIGNPHSHPDIFTIAILWIQI